MALIAFAIGILLVGDAVAGERGKVADREVFHTNSVQTLKGPDIAGHTIYLMDTKGIGFTKWGACLIYTNNAG